MSTLFALVHSYFTRQSLEPSLTGFLPDRSLLIGMLSMGLNSRCFSFTWLATMLTYIRVTSRLEWPRIRWSENTSPPAIR